MGRRKVSDLFSVLSTSLHFLFMQKTFPEYYFQVILSTLLLHTPHRTKQKYVYTLSKPDYTVNNNVRTGKIRLAAYRSQEWNEQYWDGKVKGNRVSDVD